MTQQATKQQHTPGPWEVVVGYGCSVFPADRHSSTFAIASDLTISDARLIAASPTMYSYIADKAKQGDADAAEIIAAINGDG